MPKWIVIAGIAVIVLYAVDAAMRLALSRRRP
jgi:hypothetical protein